MSIETLLNEEIKTELEFLKKLEVGTDKHKNAVDVLTKLMDRSIELEKIDIESQEKIDSREFENDLKLKQMEEDRKDRLIKNCISMVGIALPVAVTIWGTVKSFQFEKEGTITTIMGRGFINKLLPKK